MNISEGEEAVFSIKCWHPRSSDGLIEYITCRRDTEIMGSNSIGLTFLTA